MMIRRAVIMVALLGIGLGACTTDELEQEEVNQGEEEDEQDAGSQDLDASGDIGEEEDDTSADAGDDGDVEEVEDVEGAEDAEGQDVSDDGDVGEAEDVGEDAENGDVGGDAGDVGEDANDESALEGDSCETAIDVTDGAVLVEESTVAMNDNYDPVQGADNCPGTNFSDRERVYMVSPTETRTYEVVAEPEDSFDLMLYARNDCAVEACVAGTRFNGAGGVETINFEVVGGESVYIFVDGEIGHAGEFDLMVSIEE